MLSFSFPSAYQLITVLVALGLIAMGLPAAPDSAEWTHLFLTVGVGVGFTALWDFFRKKEKSLVSAIITFLIMFLVLEPIGSLQADLSNFAVLLGVGAALFIKFGGEYAERAVFNPAIAGIVAALAIGEFFPTGVSADASRISFVELFSVGGISVSLTALILAAWIFWGLQKWNRVPLFAAFIFTIAIITYFFDGGSVGVVRVLTISPFLYFFGSIILTDPKSSPDPVIRQIVFGILTAFLISLPVIFPIVGTLSGFIVEYRYFLGLLAMNFALFLFTAARGG